MRISKLCHQCYTIIVHFIEFSPENEGAGGSLAGNGDIKDLSSIWDNALPNTNPIFSSSKQALQTQWKGQQSGILLVTNIRYIKESNKLTHTQPTKALDTLKQESTTSTMGVGAFTFGAMGNATGIRMAVIRDAKMGKSSFTVGCIGELSIQCSFNGATYKAVERHLSKPNPSPCY
ncbi:Hypothetical predicted protein [Olea europaea subsp. europaea]|uniref:Uncharacterized protein n=1 Tax=Olea europaea subsp. europaea TaxID=158383 RepID=A0A8S0RT75_OLEEU|nr:Hypothetical predicted protein [Olea europaea subsp. europaea]